MKNHLTPLDVADFIEGFLDEAEPPRLSSTSPIAMSARGFWPTFFVRRA